MSVKHNDNYFADMFIRRHVHRKLPDVLKSRLWTHKTASALYAAAIAGVIAAEADFTDAAVLLDSVELEGRQALKQALIAAIDACGVLSKEQPQRHTRLSPKSQAEIAAKFMDDAHNWIALRTYLAMDELQPGWLKSRVASMLMELSVSVCIIPPGTELVNSRALYGRMRNAFGKASLAPFYVRGLTSDDIVTVSMESADDNFALVLPYVYGVIAGRNSVAVSAYIVVEIGCAERLRAVFGVKWGYELAMSDPEVLALVKAPNIRGAMSRAVELLHEAQGNGYNGARDLKQFFSYVFDREADENALAERNAVETLFTAASIDAGIPARKLNTFYSDMLRKWLLAEIAEINDNTNIAHLRLQLETSGYKLTAAERKELTTAIKARIKDRKRVGYQGEVDELEELLDVVKSA